MARWIAGLDGCRGAWAGALLITATLLVMSGTLTVTARQSEEYAYKGMPAADYVLIEVSDTGTGTVGGVFTPTLFLGAGLGTALAMGLHSAGFATGLPAHTFALVGMGSVLAATTHSPLLAMVMLFEISLNYSMMPPLMLACALATLVARQLHPDSVYTAPLKARGLEPSADTLRIGAAHQGIHVAGVVGVEGDADAGGDFQRQVVYPAGFGEDGEQFVGQLRRSLEISERIVRAAKIEAE